MQILCVYLITMIEGTPSDVFKAVAYAPSESLIFADLS